MNDRHMLRCLPLLLLALLGAWPARAAAAQDEPAGRRLQVMFFGAPTENGPHHDPITRYRVLKQAFGVEGIDLTYVEDPAFAFRSEWLSNFDAVLMYGNWNQRTPMKREQLTALLRYVDDGGGFVPVHCASACFGGSPLFVQLVGGRFARHGGEEFTLDNVASDHEILRGLEPFRAWDETYEHDALSDDREVLQTRDGEPWTWLRRQGKGRVFYTASGHDHRVWDLPQFQELLRRGVLWAVGDKRALLERLALPKLEMEEVALPGYRERKAITRAQKPLSPEQSKKLVQVPVGLEMTLFASEPDIVNPIFIAFDHRGRAFVIETIDYPNNLQAGNLGHDRITICEDSDGDGRADRFTRFAERLSIPTSLCFVTGGLLCTNGSEILFLADTDGDDVADVRRVLFDGFGMGDTHAGVSNLRHGSDGWVYATVGYSGFDGEVGGERHRFSQGVFRFRPDGSKLEYVQATTNNTWGLGLTHWGEIYGSTANGNPSFQVTFPRAAYERAGMEQPHALAIGGNPKLFPISKDIRQVDQFDRYTAAAGHTVYCDDYLGYSGSAFVCEPTGKLVGVFRLRWNGATAASEQQPNNLYASADAWSAPVCAEVGPGGAVWICDWYNLIVQHNPTPNVRAAGIDAQTGKGNAYQTPLRDKQHGRIWRIHRPGSFGSGVPPLDPKDRRVLLEWMGCPNLGVRLHCQRLLVELDDPKTYTALKIAARNRGWDAPHALHALHQLGKLPQERLETVLRGGRGRGAAISLATPDDLKRAYVSGQRPKRWLIGTSQLARALVGLSEAAVDPEIGAWVYGLAKLYGKDLWDDPVLRDAWLMVATRQAAGVLAAAERDGVSFDEPAAPNNLLPNAGFEEVVDGRPAKWTDLRHYSGARPDRVTVRSSDAGRNGTRCLELRCDAFTDSGLAYTVDVEPGTRYRLSAWVRTEAAVPRGSAPGMMLNVHGSRHTRGLEGTTDWTELSMEFEATQKRHVVHCLFGGYGGAKGAAFYDDISLVEVGNRNTLAGALRALQQGQIGGATKRAPIARTHQPDAEVHRRGQAVFQKTCIACHGVDGRGVPGTFPPLDGSRWVTGDPSVATRVVLHGLVGPVDVAGKRYLSAMAPLGPTLLDQEIADVLTFVRQSWSNDATPVSSDAVRRVREQHKDRAQMWTAAELGR